MTTVPPTPPTIEWDELGVIDWRQRVAADIAHHPDAIDPDNEPGYVNLAVGGSGHLVIRREDFETWPEHDWYISCDRVALAFDWDDATAVAADLLRAVTACRVLNASAAIAVPDTWGSWAGLRTEGAEFVANPYRGRWIVQLADTAAGPESIPLGRFVEVDRQNLDGKVHTILVSADVE